MKEKRNLEQMFLSLPADVQRGIGEDLKLAQKWDGDIDPKHLLVRYAGRASMSGKLRKFRQAVIDTFDRQHSA